MEREYLDFKDFIKALKAAERLNVDYEVKRDEVPRRTLLGEEFTVPRWTLRILSEAVAVAHIDPAVNHM